MGGALEHRADLRLRPLPAARERLLDRHAAAHGERLAARRPRLLLHPHRPDRAVPAHARQGGLLPHGLGRQRAADRAAGAELLRRPLRPVAALPGRLHAAREAGPEASGPDQPTQLRRAVRAAGAGGRAGLRAGLAPARPLGRLDPHLHDGGQPRPGDQPARVPAQLRPRRGLPRRGAHGLGRHRPHRGRAGRDRGARVPRRTTTGWPTTALPPLGETGRRCTSRRPAPS